jgi:hypothetical protein
MESVPVMEDPVAADGAGGAGVGISAGERRWADERDQVEERVGVAKERELHEDAEPDAHPVLLGSHVHARHELGRAKASTRT